MLVLCPSETLLKKISFSIVSGYQLKIVDCVHFPSQDWDPIWSRAVQSMLQQTLWHHMCISSAVFRTPRVLGILHSLWLSLSFCLLFCKVPWAMRRGTYGNAHLGQNVSRSFTLWTMSCCGFLYMFPSTVGGNSSDPCLKNTDPWVQQNVTRSHVIAVFL